jgi:hypothetical protein
VYLKDASSSLPLKPAPYSQYFEPAGLKMKPKKKAKQSYYWKINELAILFMVSKKFDFFLRSVGTVISPMMKFLSFCPTKIKNKFLLSCLKGSLVLS